VWAVPRSRAFSVALSSDSQTFGGAALTACCCLAGVFPRDDERAETLTLAPSHPGMSFSSLAQSASGLSVGVSAEGSDDDSDEEAPGDSRN
jgi:hypothetical protein